MNKLLSIFLVLSFTAMCFAAESTDNCNVNWNFADLGDSWECTCETGKEQSPVNVMTNDVKEVTWAEANLAYLMVDTHVDHEDHDHSDNLEFSVNHFAFHAAPDMGKLMVNGKVYTLANIHAHTPSEHTINGQRFDMEVHMVHFAEDQSVAVVGTFFNKDGNATEKLFKGLEKKNDQLVLDTESLETFIKEDLMRPFNHYQLDGSFTTPPCTEGVQWIVNAEVKYTNPSVINHFESAVQMGEGGEKNLTGNYRNVQGINARTVTYVNADNAKLLSGSYINTAMVALAFLFALMF